MPTGQLEHVNISVSDPGRTADLLRELAERVVVDAGLVPFSHSHYQPGPRSFYLFDWDHIEWEVVSYAQA